MFVIPVPGANFQERPKLEKRVPQELLLPDTRKKV
jgi:hypothetical protein